MLQSPHVESVQEVFGQLAFRIRAELCSHPVVMCFVLCSASVWRLHCIAVQKRSDLFTNLPETFLLTGLFCRT